jgi:hypothetical protein
MKYDIVFLTDSLSNIVPSFTRGYHVILPQKRLTIDQPIGQFTFDIENLEKLGIINIIKIEN